MPPSPALRCSPARDHQVERHKRGRSLQITPHATDRDKDDDLALFQDMQTKEKHGFLQHSGNDFTTEPPPNLLTSISDRPISRTRGSSPASRRGLSPASRPGSEAGNRSRQQSVSPTVSRSVNSSKSHDRDHFSSQSKGSAVSSCEDEMDSIQSAFLGKKRTSTVSMVHRQGTRKHETYPNSRIQSFSKKPTRSTSTINISPSSVPKRSFDSALRQMVCLLSWSIGFLSLQ